MAVAVNASNDKSLSSCRVLVTGAGTGIGRGVGLEFAAAGAALVFHYSASSLGAETAVEEVLRAGGSAKAIQADLNDVEQISRLGSEAIDFLGGLDVLVNNAGITLTESFDRVSPETYDEVFNVNMRGMYFLTQQVLPALRDGGGSVVNVSSIHAYAAMSEHSLYAATKGAIVAFTRSLALELIKQDIRVNGIAPGWILVEKHRAAMPPGFDFDAAERTIPAGFIGTPRDVGRLAIFLASEGSRYIVGQTILLDGGQSLVMPLADRISDLFGGVPPSRPE